MTSPRILCRDCAAYAIPSHGDVDGTCRRRAPTLSDGPDYFPPVEPTHWCLEALPRGEAGE